MAKRKYSKTTNIEPAVQTMTFATPGTSAGTWFIDLSQVASLVNRRFYRQGINWAVGSIKFLSTRGGQANVYKLQNTWVTANAWQKAFSAWNKQQMEAVEDAGAESAVAKFRDFKVHMNVAHVTAGFAANLLPVDSNGIPAMPGEWEASQIVLPNFTGDTPAERFLHMNGINVNGTVSRGVLEGYADSRAFPQSPDPVSPAMDSTANWLARMFDDGNDIGEVLDNATDRNDNLPYDQENYPGGQTNFEGLQWHDIVQLHSTSGTTSIGTQMGKGGNFPCGLIAINWTPEEAANLVIQINLIPGSHRGYLCETMTEM